MAGGRKSKSGGLVLTLHIEGVRETIAALNKLPKDANNELRNASLKLSQSLAGRVQAAARSEGRQAAILAPTVKARRDRVPTIVIGGSKRIGRNRKPAYKLLFGSEFGMNARSGWYANPRFKASAGRQFKSHLGRGSYWAFKTVEENEFNIVQEWRRSADAVVRAFGKDGA